MKFWTYIPRLMNLDLAVKLPLSFNAGKMAEELATLKQAYKPVIHFAPETHDGGWSALSLVSRGGSVFEADLKGDIPYMETEALHKSPYLKEVVNTIPGIKERVRLLGLEPNKKIFWHFDASESVDFNRIRLHIPIITNDKVLFFIGHQRCIWQPGDLWYGDFSFPHFIHNQSTETRYHLVLDVKLDNELQQLFPPNYLEEKKRRKIARKLTNDSMYYSNLLSIKTGFTPLVNSI